MILTPQRLAALANWKGLSDSWFLVATVTLTVCNQPQEIPRLYHYAMHLKYLNESVGTSLFDKVSQVLDRYAEVKARGENLDYSPYTSADLNQAQLFQTTEQFRESIMKTAALSGLPKCINSMMMLKESTPANLKRNPGSPNRKPIESWEQYQQVQQRGRDYWNKVYTKISGRVSNQMASSYPDLWQHAIQDVYSPLLSYVDVLSEEQTSLVVISALVPQNVTPQLKGHVKGALNSGVEQVKVDGALDMANEISGWCQENFTSHNSTTNKDNVAWRNGSANVAHF